MRTISDRFRSFARGFLAFVDGNKTFTVFLVGFLSFSAGLAAWSVPVAGVVGGALLMAVAVYPYVSRAR